MTSVEVLGPLTVTVHGRPVPFTSGTLRTLFVVLAMAADSPVSIDRLAEAVWDDGPPRNVRRTVQTHLTRLRSALGADLIVTEPAGYRLRLDPERVDALRFTRLLDLAAQASDPGTERARVESALALWRGIPFEDVRSDRLERVRNGLVERYLAAVERRVDLDLAERRHADVVVELRQLTAAYPLRESLWVRLLTALAGRGRQAEALAGFESVRRLLAEELGADPGLELRQLHADLLTAPPPSTGAAVPRQLPSDIDGFTGRAAALKALHALVDDGGEPTTAVRILVIAGMAGIGKTTLAVRWAHQIADRFPDGQLYVDLRGFDQSGQVVTQPEAARRFLDALGVAPERIPADPDAQLGMYRSALVGRRVLVVLDNARDAAQVRPLLPGTAGCLVLVTSRNRLTGLVATEAARPLVLDVLADDEARELFAVRVGPDRVAAEPAAADAIVARGAGLPLALAVAAARVATSSLSLAAVAGQLDDERSMLDTFETGDPAADARVVFSWSCRTLSPAAARLFRLLGLHPGPDVAAAAVASLAGVPRPRARALLTELLGVHLLTEHTPGRYTTHDLLRAYATELTESHDSDDERRAAVHRLLDHYLHTAYGAAMVINPHRDPITVVPARSGVTPETPVDHDAALAWYTAEHPLLSAVVDLAVTAGFDTHVWQLAWAVADFLYRRGDWHGWLTTQQAGLAAAQRLADLPAQASTRTFLGVALLQVGRHADAHPHLEAALDLHERLGNRLGQAKTRYNLGSNLARQGRHTEAIEHTRVARDIAVAIGDRLVEGMALNAIGWYHAHLGDHRAALAHCERALVLLQETGDLNHEGSTWDSLGYAHHGLGNHERSVECYRKAIELFEQLDNRYYQASTLANLGDTYRSSGDLVSARATWRRALTMLDDLGHPEAEQVRAKLSGSAPAAP